MSSYDRNTFGPLFNRYDDAPKPQAFAGETFDAEHDQSRLTRQLDRVRALMSDGSWRTLGEIAAVVPGSETALSARLRDIRKSGLTVDRRRRGDAKRGLHEYRVTEGK